MLKLYHGSENIIKTPEIGNGKINNDYGRGFYCIENADLAKEWACVHGTDGYLNAYNIEMDGLS